MPTIPIHIRTNAPTGPGYHGDVTVEPTQVHARKPDVVRWQLQGGGRFTLTFLHGTPFDTSELNSDANGSCESIVKAGSGGTYLYAINGTTAAGVPFAITNCPEIIIE